MNKSEPEIWKSHPEYAGIEVSTLGRVRTLDKMVRNGSGTRSLKGRVLKQFENHDGYMQIAFSVNGKVVSKLVHRLVAQTFLPNPDNLPMVNHKSCIRDDNRVENLEFCTASYNIQYREKYGESLGVPVLAINLTTLEVSRFKSQREASRVLGVLVSNINAVIKGTQKTAHGFWFVNDNSNGIEIDKDKLNNIVDGMRFRGGVFAVNLTTLEVSRFRSQHEAGRVLGVSNGSINDVLKGKRKQAGGYWFVNDDGHKDAQSVRDYSDQAVKSVNAK